MKPFLLLSVLLLAAATGRGDKFDTWFGRSPNKKLFAVERRVPVAGKPTRLDLDGFTVFICTDDGGAPTIVAQHTFSARIVSDINWSPDSQFLVFSTTSSGGHSPWHFETFVFVVSDRTFRVVDELIGPVTGRKPDFAPPDTVTFKVRDYSHEFEEPGSDKDVRIRLSDVSSRMPLAQ